MKIKTDFVTNSSSTGFFFIFKDNKKNLIKSLKNYKDQFNFEDCGYEKYCENHYCLDSFIDLIRDRKIKSKPVENLINGFKVEIYNTKKLQEKLKREKNTSMGGWIKGDLKESEKRLNAILDSDISLNKYIELDCGNDGKIKGPLSQCIRCNYPRRFIKKDLVVVTDERS